MRRADVPERPSAAVDDPTLVYGRHAVQAALANPRRQVVAIRHTPQAADALAAILAAVPAGRRAVLPRPQPAERADIEAGLPAGAVHQGLALKVAPLPDPDLAGLIAGWEGRDDVVVVVLDQVTDPHNVGAVLRSAAAFGAAALVLQDRHGPPVTGALAKTASGALDVVPMARVVNLARALRDLQGAGFWCTGLAEEGAVELAQVDLGGRCALVLGAEGSGLRRLTRESCDALARLPTCPPIGSLNVSAAAAVALYQARLARTAAGDLQSING
jgi:23S rRNA (guanosine2251-2'-O)-methyltransferase